MALRRVKSLKVSQMSYLVGFENFVKTRLTPVKINGETRPPRPDSVRKILSGERESRRMLLDIFQNGTDLMKHPSVGAKVRKAFEYWRKHGVLPEAYGIWRK